MKLKLEIHHLIVDGSGPADVETLQAQVRDELTSRFANGGWPNTNTAFDRMTVRTPDEGESTGARLGSALHGVAARPR